MFRGPKDALVRDRGSLHASLSPPSASRSHSTIRTAFGSAYVNDIIQAGRIKRVYVGADALQRRREGESGLCRDIVAAGVSSRRWHSTDCQKGAFHFTIRPFAWDQTWTRRPIPPACRRARPSKSLTSRSASPPSGGRSKRSFGRGCFWTISRPSCVHSCPTTAWASATSPTTGARPRSSPNMAHRDSCLSRTATRHTSNAQCAFRSYGPVHVERMRTVGRLIGPFIDPIAQLYTRLKRLRIDVAPE